MQTPLARGAAACGAPGVALPLGFTKWMMESPWKMSTSSMPGMVLTPSRLRVFCSFLSSVVAVLCTVFFLLREAAAGEASRAARAGVGALLPDCATVAAACRAQAAARVGRWAAAA
jgi:hypothetical protein